MLIIQSFRWRIVRRINPHMLEQPRQQQSFTALHGSLAPHVRNFTLRHVTHPRLQPMVDRSGRSHVG
jgi:hypothetical protein